MNILNINVGSVWTDNYYNIEVFEITPTSIRFKVISTTSGPYMSLKSDYTTKHSEFGKRWRLVQDNSEYIL